MSNKMYAKSKRNEMIKSGAYDGRYKEKVISNKRKPSRKTQKLKTNSEIKEDLYNEQSVDVIGDAYFWDY